MKRHFQKCSVRRGNPTGASHLSNPAAHLKKSQNAAKNSAGASISSAETTPNQIPGTYGQTSMGGAMAPNASAYPDTTSMSNANAQAPAGSLARSEEVYTGYNAAPNQNWQQMNPKQHNPMLFHPASTSPDHFAVSSSSEDKRSILAAAPPHQGEQEWLYPSGQEQYIFPSSMSNGYDSMTAHSGDVKKEYDGHEQGQGNYYMPSTTFGADGTLGPGPLLWATDSSQDDPVQLKANQLVDFCFPGGLQESLKEHEHNAQLRACMTADNIKHFLNSFTNWQGHFPYLHMPTFSFNGDYNGLILSIVCIGAVYSDKASEDTVRLLIQRTKQGISRTSHFYQQLRDPNANRDPTPVIPSLADLEHLQACLMLQVLSIWHGGPKRALARADCPMWATVVRRYRMLETTKPQDDSYSPLHNLQPQGHIDPSSWKWETWVEQEKRLRLLYFIYLLDAALCVWFNCAPQLDPAEIQLPLPADDAAWEAKTSEECARALGLRGLDAQATFNTGGSLRSNQPQLHLVLAGLLDPSVGLQQRTTNVYSKFILIHALLVQIWMTHQRLALGSAAPPSQTFDPATGWPFLPLSQQASLTISGIPYQTTPIQSPGNGNLQILQTINGGLARFKQIWDSDMLLQYPPSQYAMNPIRRIGFCRDGLLFYWMAKWTIQSNRLADWQLAPDQRFLQVMNLLKQARQWAQSDAAQRGEETGSANEAVKDFPPAASSLVLDMKKLFRPLDALYDTSQLEKAY